MSARTVAGSILPIMLLSLSLPAPAQDGVYTEAQAAAGSSSYLVNCVGCHQADLGGENEAKPLVGADFMSAWRDRTAAQLIAFMQVTMPPMTAPRSTIMIGSSSAVRLSRAVWTSSSK